MGERLYSKLTIRRREGADKKRMGRGAFRYLKYQAMLWLFASGQSLVRNPAQAAEVLSCPLLNIKLTRLGSTSLEEEAMLRTVTEDVLKMAGDLKLPPQLHMKVHSRSTSTSIAMALPLNREISVTPRGLQSGLPSRRLSSVQVSHEVGHLIFHENMQALYDGNAQIQSMVAADPYRIAQRQVLAQIEALQNKRLQSTNEEVREALADEISELKWKNRDNEELRFPESYLGIPHNRAYNEFFADLVAVLHSGDPNAVARVVGEDYPSLPPGALVPLEIEGRNFLSNIQSDRWYKNEEHILFAPLRAFVGKNYLNPRVHREAKILRAAMDAIAEEFIALSQLPNQGYSLGIAERNTRLIGRFLKKLPLGAPP